MSDWSDDQKEAIARIQRVAYLHGRIDATADYAVWKNGTQYVGVMQRPLAEIIKPMRDEIDGYYAGNTQVDGGK
jgi:hypothetical protein